MEHDGEEEEAFLAQAVAAPATAPPWQSSRRRLRGDTPLPRPRSPLHLSLLTATVAGQHYLNRRSSSSSPPADYCAAATTSLGELGDMMVSMLPKNLAFTVFVPSPETFRRVLKLRHNDSVAEGKADDGTYAVVSRVLGFSAVPRRLRAADVAPLRRRQQVAPVLESVFGLRISAWRRDADGALVVNGVPSECVDIVKDQAIVHDRTEFERSFSSELDN